MAEETIFRKIIDKDKIDKVSQIMSALSLSTF